MNFDPAIEAQIALQRCRARGELGPRWEEAEELEEQFSSSAGPEASDAYRRLVALGHEHPSATAYLEFLVYITWQQVTEHTVPEYFRQGARLCDQFLALPEAGSEALRREQVHTLRTSFREGLGLAERDELDEEYRRDTPKGGD